MSQPVNTNRIEVVDALRGFAIMGIMLLHNIEHFDFYYFPQNLPPLVKTTDGYIWDSLFFLFSGKAYAIFALLFGFSFFIMDRNQRQKGYDFSGRFLWRMLILLGFGLINSLFFEGDILTFYAVFGITLLAVNHLKTLPVLVIAAIMLLQPVEWGKVIYFLANPGAVPSPNLSDHYFGQMGTYLSGPSFWEMAKGNFTNGRLAVIFWSWENGRFFQAPALFMLGMLLGRHSKFVATDASIKFWKVILVIAITLAVPLYVVKQHVGGWISQDNLKPSVSLIVNSVYNLSFTFLLVSSFVLLFQTSFWNKIFKPLATFGKMSLTNYLMQSLMGAFVYYGFALGLYQYTGATYSLLIGIVLFLVQFWFCKWWLNRHKQGPLEYLWHKATWVGRN